MYLGRTRFRLLITLAVLAGSLGWSLGRLWPHWFLTELAVPVANAVTMWLISAALLVWTIVARPKLTRQKFAKPLPPIVAARTAALALSGSRAGSLVFGFYIGLLIINLNLTRTPEVTARLMTITLVLIAAALLIGVSLWLERLCEVKQPPDDGAAAQRT